MRQDKDVTPEAAPVDANRRELLKKLGKTAYIAPVTLALLSSSKAAASVN